MSKNQKKQPSKEQLIQIIERTDDLFDRMCSGVVKGKSADEMYIVWEGNLSNGVKVQAKLYRGCVGFVIGFVGGTMLLTEQVLEKHEKMIKDFEQIILRAELRGRNSGGDA